MTKKLLVWTMKDLRDCIEQMIANKFDCLIWVEGKRGIGKSSFGYKLLASLNIPIPFKPKRDIVYTREDIIKHLASKKGGCILADEMIMAGYNRDFWNEEQNILVKALNMYRDSCNILVGCIPVFSDLDIKLRQLCKIRISVVRRGIALIQTQISSIYTSDGWDLKNNQKIESAWTTKGFKNPRYSQLTTCRGIMKFGDLGTAQREEYEAIKAEKRNRIFDRYQDKDLLGNPQKVFIDKLIVNLKKGLLNPASFYVLAEINNIKPDELRRKVNVALKEAGDTKRWKDYCFDAKKKERRDKLGFLISPDTLSSHQEVVLPQNTTPQEEIEAPKEDIFGFNKADSEAIEGNG